MRKFFLIFPVFLSLLILISGCTIDKKDKIPLITIPMKLESPAFSNNDYLPAKYTCDGLEINPPLEITSVPSGTKSLALIVDDPDAPNGDFVHWLVWNILPNTAQIAEGVIPPDAIQGSTSSGEQKYVSPCPPSGTHHYIFKIYALDTKLNLKGESTKPNLLSAMEGHILGDAKLIGLYTR